jgi:ribosomal-protein-alanine N-acetyltransferase
MFTLRSDKEVNAWLDRAPAMSLDEAAAFIQKVNKGIERDNCFYWGIALLESQVLIGTICIWNILADRKTAEVGFELLPAWQGRGFAQEALKAVITFCFDEAGFTTLLALTHKQNLASIRLLENSLFVTGKEDPPGEDPNLLQYRLQKERAMNHSFY